MSTRYLIAALLMTSACVAQADVLPANGGASASLVQALYGKTSADQSGAVTMNLADSVEGPYVIGTSNTIMAAMLGYGMSSVFHRSAVDTPVSFPAADSATVSAPAALAPVATDPVAEVIADAGVGSGSNQDVAAPVAGPLADTPTTPVADAGDVGTAADEGEVPEPSSIALMMAGMAGALALGRRRRNR